jgi:RNA polymerase sigma-70 factor (ECF subfamily)
MTPFAITRWSLILEARGSPKAARAALEEICRAYRHPVLAYICRSGHHATEAEDLTQEFFTRMLEHRWDIRADPARGRFRAFLLTTLKRFLLDADAAAGARKRGGGQFRVEYDDAAEALAAPPSQSPEEVFDRAWALTVIGRAYGHLREEAAAAGKGALLERLAPFLGESADATDYRRLGAELDLRANTVAVSVHRLRLRLRELIRAELADLTDGPDAVEIELRALRAALAADAPVH